jgi:hypothetical protein
MAAALAVLAGCLIAVSAAGARTSLAPSGTGYARLVQACPPPQPGSASCFAVARLPVSSPVAVAGTAVQAYTAGDGAAAAGPAGGLTPAELSSAYGYDRSGGSGQTVAVIDAFDDPKIEEDLAVFDSHYGFGECTKANGCFRKVNEEGGESPSALPAADETGWSQEISLDVETVRAVCQGCKILLVEAASAHYKDLARAADEAVALGATEVSNSYGGPEQGMGSEERAAYDHPGVVVTAATGDNGYDDWNYPLLGRIAPGMPNAPASLSSVVSVGGTRLALHEGGTRASETVWNDDGVADEQGAPAGYVTSGGCSTLFEAPPWQRDSGGFAASGCGGQRLAADVSADADPLSGVDIYDNFDYCATGSKCEAELKEAIERHGGWLTFGGTSLGTPMIASLYALAGGGAGLRDPALTLYGHIGDGASLYDVTEGGNGFCDAQPASVCGHPNGAFGETLDCEGTTACDAARGLDGPSGVGTPNGLAAFKPLSPTAVLTPPATLEAGTPAAFSALASHDPYPGGVLSHWSWNWGDGTPESHEAAPTHTYAVGGERTVSLTVTDNYGLTSLASKEPVHVLSESAPNKKHEEEAPATANVGASPAAQGVFAFQTAIAPVPDAQLAGTSLRVSKSGTVTVKISCPAGESICSGSVTLRTLGAVSAGVAEMAGRAILVLTKGTFTAAGGKLSAVTLHLSAKARVLLGRLHVLRASSMIVAHDLAGATHTARAIVTLRPVNAKNRKG